MTKIAVIYYSATGNVHALAEAVAEGAAEAGAQVRLRRVPELAPAEAVDSNPAWRAHVDATVTSNLASTDAVRWADALAFGSPARFGNISAPLKQFLETTGPLWSAGELTNKVATGFTSAHNLHGGNESIARPLQHDASLGGDHRPVRLQRPTRLRRGRQPHGTAHASGGGPPGSDVLAAARYQGRRLAAIAELIAGGEREERLAA
jgi:NAD(P)H dehydrogenase (quinone)